MTHRSRLLLDSLTAQLARLEEMCAAPYADAAITPRLVGEKVARARQVLTVLDAELKRDDVIVLASHRFVAGAEA